MISKKLVLSGAIFLTHIGLFADVDQLTVENKTQNVQMTISNEMKMLNDVLALFPMTTVRMKFAEQKARVIGKQVEDWLQSNVRSLQQDDKFIQDQLKGVIEPIKQFFELIRSYKNIAQPLVKECLQVQDYRKSIAPEESFLYKFFDKNGTVEEIASQEIKTVESFSLLCKDIASLCEFVLVRLSDRAQDAYKKAMSELQNRTRQNPKNA